MRQGIRQYCQFEEKDVIDHRQPKARFTGPEALREVRNRAATLGHLTFGLLTRP